MSLGLQLPQQKHIQALLAALMLPQSMLGNLDNPLLPQSLERRHLTRQEALHQNDFSCH